METKNPENRENNPETGTNNVFRRENGALPEEAGAQGSSLTPATDKGDLGRKTHMEQTSFRDPEGHETMDDDESREGLGNRLPGEEPGAG